MIDPQVPDGDRAGGPRTSYTRLREPPPSHADYREAYRKRLHHAGVHGAEQERLLARQARIYESAGT